LADSGNASISALFCKSSKIHNMVCFVYDLGTEHCFKDVFHGDDALDTAVLIYNHEHMLTLLQKLLQSVVKRDVLGNESDLTLQTAYLC
jgi:hypothetical protein